MYLDISGPFPIRRTLVDPYKTKVRGTLYWMGLSDQYSSKMLMSFGITKDGLYSMLEECIVHMDLLGHPIKTIRMDNAVENTSRALKRLCDEDSIRIEYTPPDTPKLNGVVERGFAIRWEMAKTLMQAARLIMMPNISEKFWKVQSEWLELYTIARTVSNCSVVLMIDFINTLEIRRESRRNILCHGVL
jgi:transposase InsO family protein